MIALWFFHIGVDARYHPITCRVSSGTTRGYQTGAGFIPSVAMEAMVHFSSMICVFFPPGSYVRLKRVTINIYGILMKLTMMGIRWCQYS